MKIIINYDLINQIIMANTGFNLNRFSTKMGLNAPINLAFLAVCSDITLANIITGPIIAASLYSSSEFFLAKINKNQAEANLRTLASKLEKIHIYTSADLLKKATAYKTQYSLETKEENKTPRIIQNKFIMVPTTGCINNDEVSLQQEHEIGSDEYVLSMGEPKKAHILSLVKPLYRTATNR